MEIVKASANRTIHIDGGHYDPTAVPALQRHALCGKTEFWGYDKESRNLQVTCKKCIKIGHPELAAHQAQAITWAQFDEANDPRHNH